MNGMQVPTPPRPFGKDKDRQRSAFWQRSPEAQPHDAIKTERRERVLRGGMFALGVRTGTILMIES